MSDNTQQKPELLKMGIVVAISLVGLIAFGVHKYNAHQAAEARQAVVKQAIAADPVFQIILQQHKVAKKYMMVMLSRGIDAKGDEGMKDEARKLQWLFDDFYMPDYNWYAKSDAIKNFLSVQYRLLYNLANDKNKHKHKQCDSLLHGNLPYQKLEQIAGKEEAAALADARRNIILSAQERKLSVVWPGSPMYNEALKATGQDLALKMLQFDPSGTLAQKAFQSWKDLKCKDVLPMFYAMLLIPPNEAALLWRVSIEMGAPAVKADRKKRGLE